jgi:hypothetical protein
MRSESRSEPLTLDLLASGLFIERRIVLVDSTGISRLYTTTQHSVADSRTFAMIIWQGLGFLVAVIVFGCSLAGNFISNATLGEGYYDQHKWPVALSLICSAPICWFLGRYLRAKSDRIAIDNATGKEFVINQSRHTLFFIPMEYWSPILIVIALVLFGLEFLG